MTLLIWSLVSLYDEIRLEVWHIPYSFRYVQGPLLASAQKTVYNKPSCIKSNAIDRLLGFCCKNSILKIIGLPAWGSNPGPSAQQASDHNHPTIQLLDTSKKLLFLFLLRIPVDMNFTTKHQRSLFTVKKENWLKTDERETKNPWDWMWKIANYFFLWKGRLVIISPDKINILN